METKTTEGVVELKVDNLGRRTTSAQRRDELLRQYEVSGQSQAQFAREHGVSYPTFATWVQKRREGVSATSRKKTASKNNTSDFVQVELSDTRASENPVFQLRVRFVDGLELEGSDVVALASLVKALRG